MNLRFWKKKKKPSSPTPAVGYKGKSAMEQYLRCNEYLEQMEKQGELHINSARGGVVMTLPIYQYFFTEGYLKHSDDRRAMAFLDKVRATINLRRAIIDPKQEALSFFAPEDPLYITVASATDTSKPLFVGLHYGEKLLIEEAEGTSADAEGTEAR